MNNDKMIAFVLSLNSVEDMLKDGYCLTTDDEKVSNLGIELDGNYTDSIVLSEGYANEELIASNQSLEGLADYCCSWSTIDECGYHELGSAWLSFICNKKNYRVEMSTSTDQVDWNYEFIDNKKSLCCEEDRERVFWSSTEKKWFRFDGQRPWNW